MPNPWSAKDYAQDGKYLPEDNGSTVHFPATISRSQAASGENVPNFWAYLNGVKFCTDGGLYSARAPQFTDDDGTIINAKPSIADAEVFYPYVYGSTNDFYYNGEAHTLEQLSVTYNKIELKEGEDYKLSYSNNVNAGNNTAVCTITGINNYSGTKDVTFSIGKRESTIEPGKGTSTISLAAQSKAYTGKALAYSGKVTKSGSTGAVAYKYYSDAACKNEVKAANVKNVGVYYVKATVAAEGNWKAATSAAVKFTIAPKGTKLSSLKALRKGFTAKWAKQSSQTSGYQVQYSLKGNFSAKNKTVTIGRNTTVSKKIKKLKAKKKYYVRVRTYRVVNGTKLYSSWSAAKAVKTK